MKLGEFFIDLFVDSAQGELTVSNLVTKMGQLEVATVGALGVFFQIGTQMAKFTDTSIAMALGLEDYTTLTGESAQRLQDWQRVAAHVNVSGQDVTKTFMGLSAAIASMARGGGAGSLQPLVDRLHLDLRGKGPEQLLELIRHSEEFKLLSPAAKTDLLTAAHIAPLMTRLLEMSDDQFNKHASLVPGMSLDQEHRLIAMSTTLSDIGSVAKQLAIDIGAWNATGFLTTLSAILEKLKSFREWYVSTTDEQVKQYNMVMHPFTKESATSWGDIARFVGEDIKKYVLSGEALRTTSWYGLVGGGSAADLLGALGGASYLTPAMAMGATSTPVVVNQYMNPVHTPEAYAKAAKEGAIAGHEEAVGRHGSTERGNAASNIGHTGLRR